MTAQSTRSDSSIAHTDVAPLRRLARRLLRWLAVLLVLTVLLFGCGQLALWNPFPQALADTRSKMAADYAPWPFMRVAALDPAIIAEIQRDLQAEGEEEVPSIPRLGGLVDLWPAPSPTAAPEEAGTSPTGAAPTPGPGATGAPPSSTTTGAAAPGTLTATFISALTS